MSRREPELPALPILWNILPFHPYKSGKPLSNRTPLRGEQEAGFAFLLALRSIFMDATGPADRRCEVRGPLVVTWLEPPDEAAAPRIEAIDGSGLELVERTGPPPFQPVLTRLFERKALEGPGTLIAWDLDGDGRSELILTGQNLIFRNLGSGTFREEPLVAHVEHLRGG
jgi:hypothetical protein